MANPDPGVKPGSVSAIFHCPRAGAPMQAATQVHVTAGFGLDGDRYALGIGAYSAIEPVKIRHASFISQDGLDAANAWLAEQGLPAFAAVETRRNFLLSGIPAEALNALVGHVFSVGGVIFKGLELATPCHRPSRLLKRGGIFESAFAERGGLRAEAFSSGDVRVGDALIQT